jgi:hypothetical protein
MGALATRELIVAARTASVPLASLGMLALLTAFVLVWSPGVPALATMNLYEQARVLHWVLLAAALPWIAVRSSPMDRGEALVMVTAFIGLRPASVIAAKVLASFIVLVSVTLTGVPGLVMAQQAAAVPLATVFADLLPLAGFALLIAASSNAAILLASDGLRAWLWASGGAMAILVTAVAWIPELSMVGVWCALAGVLGTACMCSTAGRYLTYLDGADDA